MSSSGFTTCFLFVVTLASAPELADVVTKLGFVLLILPTLGTGLAIWLDSVTTAHRTRNAASIGTAAYNTFAMAHNAYEAATSRTWRSSNANAFAACSKTRSAARTRLAAGSLGSARILSRTDAAALA